MRRERKARGLTLETVAERLGLKRPAPLSTFERSRHVPKADTISAYATAIGCTPGDLLAGVVTEHDRLRGATAPTPAKTVDANLQAMEATRTGPPWNAKTRARFRVFVSTGKRPCEIMRAQPGDVNLEARVWVPRDAKGGFCPGVYLNDDQRAAWQLFLEAAAWGPYSTGAFARTLRSAGWPVGVRPYQARHTTWITASELGIDLEDIAVGAGHKDSRITRRVYVPVLNSRLQALGQALEGRFQGWPVVPLPAPARKPQRR